MPDEPLDPVLLSTLGVEIIGALVALSPAQRAALAALMTAEITYPPETYDQPAELVLALAGLAGSDRLPVAAVNGAALTPLRDTAAAFAAATALVPAARQVVIVDAVDGVAGRTKVRFGDGVTEAKNLPYAGGISTAELEGLGASIVTALGGITGAALTAFTSQIDGLIDDYLDANSVTPSAATTWHWLAQSTAGLVGVAEARDRWETGGADGPTPLTPAAGLVTSVWPRDPEEVGATLAEANTAGAFAVTLTNAAASAGAIALIVPQPVDAAIAAGVARRTPLNFYVENAEGSGAITFQFAGPAVDRVPARWSGDLVAPSVPAGKRLWVTGWIVAGVLIATYDLEP